MLVGCKSETAVQQPLDNADIDGEIRTTGSPPDASGARNDGAGSIAEVTHQQLADDPLTILREPPPVRDLRSLALRLGRLDPTEHPDPPRTLPGPPPDRASGDIEDFWVHDIAGNRYFQVSARLEIITDVVYFWVQVDQPFDREGLERGARIFSDDIVPKMREIFGHEWSPGVDADPRLHVLHHESTPGVAGFFSSTDEYTALVEPYSNEREMFYVNIESYAPGSADYLQLLAHEFQHMIHWHHDRGEPVWSNEGLSELAPYLVGYGRQTGAALISRPDTPLTHWQPTSAGNAPQYAASFLFFAWLWGQYGDDVLKAIVQAQGNGEAGIEDALDIMGTPARFDDLFMDWTVANLLNDPSAGSGRWTYHDVSVRTVTPRPLPLLGTDTEVHQFGANYWAVTDYVRDGALDLRFEGATTVPLLDEGSTERGRVWWSNRGDDIDSRLTHAFDLSDVETAELRFMSWWSIEENWDYGYLLASTDDGLTWLPLESAHTTTANPNGNSFGAARTGESGGWVEEVVDLTPYAGADVLLRYEMITDDAISLSGWAIDDIRIDAIGFREVPDRRAAGMASDWEAEGWLVIDPALLQRWGVQAVVHSATEADAHRFEVASGQALSVYLADIPGDATVTLIVSGLTHVTRNVGRYQLWDPMHGTPPAGYP